MPTHTIKKYLTFFITLLLFSQTSQTIALSTSTKVSLAATGAVTTYLCYSYISSPEHNKPTLNTMYPLSALPLNDTDFYKDADQSFIKTASTTYLLQPGTSACTINCAEPLWVLASGWKPLFDQMVYSRIESSSSGLRRYLKRNIFHGPSITFIYQDNRRAFNFGQDLDQQSFDTLYQATENKNLILYGLCRGARTILGWLTAYENNNTIKAVILESPTLSFKDICYDIGKHYTNLSLQGSILYFLFKTYFPNYVDEKDLLLNKLEKLHLADDTPIFIGHIQGDQITTDEKVTLLVKTLRVKRKNPLYFFVCKERLDHGTLSRSLAYQQTINAFLKKYGLPHNASYAEQGLELLAQAQETI